MCIKKVTVLPEAVYQNFEYDDIGTSRYWEKYKNETSDCPNVFFYLSLLMSQH